MKQKIKKYLYKMPKCFRKIAYKIYYFFVYPEGKEKKCSYGNENPNRTYYVIRPIRNSVEGLMSLLNFVCLNIKYATFKGFDPVVDFKNYKTQYNINDLDNAWEYFFEKLGDTNLEDVYKSKNVVVSGLEQMINPYWDDDNWFCDDALKEIRSIVNDYICVRQDILDKVNNEIVSLNLDKTLGLYLRGTDYTSLKPSGHPIQPNIESACLQAKEIMNKNGLDSVFLVTEDEKIYKKVKEYFEDKLHIVSFDKFISNYENRDFLSNSNSISELSNNSIERGTNYLIKILILSKCNSIVAGNTKGSLAACAFSKGYKTQYIYNVGKY